VVVGRRWVLKRVLPVVVVVAVVDETFCIVVVKRRGIMIHTLTILDPG